MISRQRRDLYGLIEKSTMGCVLVFVMLSLTCPASAGAQNQVRIDYGEATAPELILAKSAVVGARYLEGVAKLVEHTLPLPPGIILTLATAQCDEVNFFYIREAKSITLCYEMFNYISKRSPDPGLFRGVTFFLVLHEFGHAFIDIYRLPVTGRREDVADQYASVWMLEARKYHPNEKFRPLMTDGVYAALFFLWTMDGNELSEKAYRNEHGMPRQRGYNLRCLAYGSDSIEFGHFKSTLQDRAPGCKDEYEQALDSFKKLVLLSRSLRGG